MSARNAGEAAWAELDRLTDGSPGKLWRWSIPADPERDSDLILAAGLKAVADERDAALAVIERVRVELEDVAEDTPSIPDVNEWADCYRVSNALEVIWEFRGAAK